MDLADIYTRHRQGLFTHALSITGCAGAAEDAVQEAFARICRGSSRSSQGASAGAAPAGAAPPGAANGNGISGGLAGRIADPVAYVFTAVRSAAIDQRRRARRRGPVVDDRDSLFASFAAGPNAMAAGAPTSRDSPQDRAIEAEVAAGVAAAVDALPDDVREVLVLRVYGGLSFAQIAAVRREPLSTVASRYRRALERLRGRLEKLV